MQHGRDYFEPVEDTGMEMMDLARALQCWALCQEREAVTVGEASAAFNVQPYVIREAVELHTWMLIGNPDAALLDMRIEHDGD